MAFTQQQIYDALVAGNQAGMSNADIIAKLGTYGVSPMQAAEAYGNARPDLFGSTEQFQATAASAPLTEIAALQSDPQFQTRTAMQDYARQFEPPPPDPASTYYTTQGGGITPISEKQIYDGMVASNQAGFSNADILAGGAKYGLNEGAFMNAYQSQRPELFDGSTPAPSTLPATIPPSSLTSSTGLPAYAGAQQPLTGRALLDSDPALLGALSTGGGNTQSGGANPYLTGGNTQAGAPSGYGGFGYQSNPWMSQTADEIGRRNNQQLQRGLQGIRSNAVGNGTLGGSRQGVAEGLAISGAMDSLQGNLAGLFGSDWTNSQNRDLSRYGMDQGFFTAQRGQDLTQLGLGAQITDMGYRGGWMPLQNASGIFNTTAGNNVTQTSGGQQGGGWQGLLGGALSGATLGRQAGWW